MNQTEREREITRREREEQTTHKKYRQPGERDLPMNVCQLAWMHTHLHVHTHTSVTRREDGELVEHKTGSLLDPLWVGRNRRQDLLLSLFGV